MSHFSKDYLKKKKKKKMTLTQSFIRVLFTKYPSHSDSCYDFFVKFSKITDNEFNEILEQAKRIQ